MKVYALPGKYLYKYDGLNVTDWDKKMGGFGLLQA